MKISLDHDLDHEVEETWKRVRKGKSKQRKPRTMSYSGICSAVQMNYHMPKYFAVFESGKLVGNPLAFVAKYLKEEIGVTSRQQIDELYPSEIVISLPGNTKEVKVRYVRRNNRKINKKD